MTTAARIAIVVLVACTFGGDADAQTSSLGARHRRAVESKPPIKASREAPRIERNAIYEEHAWISVKAREERQYMPGDLITIIVRERRRFEADADLETKSRFDIKSELDSFIKATAGGIGASEFRRGKPNLDYTFDMGLKKEGDTRREDRMTMRLTGRVIDVKPNGLLVVEARARIQHDEEISEISVTGVCRKEDVTADNTILSTQIADKRVGISNEGALRSAASRGWIARLVDWMKPF